MALSPRQKQIDAATKASHKVALDEFTQLLNSPRRLAWLNFYAGFTHGAGSVLGAAIIIVVIGLAVNYLGGIPFIGALIHKVGLAAHIKP